MKWTGTAFVSLRIMIALRDTYKTYRDIIAERPTAEPGNIVTKIEHPKTLKQGLDSFLNLFKKEQIDILKTTMNYDKFIVTIEEKNKLPLKSLNTPEEEKEAKKFIDDYNRKMATKIA